MNIYFAPTLGGHNSTCSRSSFVPITDLLFIIAVVTCDAVGLTAQVRFHPISAGPVHDLDIPCTESLPNFSAWWLTLTLEDNNDTQHIDWWVLSPPSFVWIFLCNAIEMTCWCALVLWTLNLICPNFHTLVSVTSTIEGSGMWTGPTV